MKTTIADIPSRVIAAIACLLAGIAVALTLLHGAAPGPRGYTGPQGAQGQQGPAGADGTSAPVLGYVCQMLFPLNGVETTGYWPCSTDKSQAGG